MAYSGYGYTQQPQVSQEVMMWFQSVDLDRSGHISAAELKLALTNADWSTFSESSCRAMINMFDRDGTQTIDVSEFQALWNYLNQWRAMFSSIDTNRSGYIEHAELKQALTNLGYRLSDQFIANIIAKYDPKSRQRINMDNFIMVCILLHRFTEAFKQRDPQFVGSATFTYEDFINVVMSGAM
jgi:Ca2+-binding EF-hand superfamily protein